LPNKKKIIVFIPSIEGGGVEKNLFLIINFLAEQNFNIKLITANPEFKKKFNKKIEILSPKNKSRCTRYQKYFYCLILLFKILLTKEYLVFSFQANIYAILIAKLLKRKILIRSNSSPEGWSKNIIKKKLYKYIFKLSDGIIVNSKNFQKQMKEAIGVSTTWIYNPLNKKEILLKSKEKVSNNFFKNTSKTLKIISIGRFVDQKDHMCLLYAFNLIKNKINAKLLLVGKGIKKNEYINFIKKNNLSKKVKILNFQKNPYKFIKKSDVFILTSKFEGLPNVLLEAMTLKKFIISSNCPTGPDEILLNGKFGNLFKIGDYEMLANLILNLKNYTLINQSKILKGYKSLGRFDFSKNCKKYLKTINNLYNE
jgi:glycosyltransferase involved in cell wall biosynthesis